MGILRIIRRDVGSQIATARNLKEPVSVRMFRYLLTARFLLKAICCGLRSIRKEQLGSKVVLLDTNEIGYVSNWAGCEFVNVAAESGYRQNVPRKLIRNKLDVREAWHRFEFGFSFYTGSWMGIDINRVLYKI